MTTITRVDAVLADLAPATERVDAMQAFVKQETVIVTVHSSDGFTGTGYSYTIGTGGRAVLSMITDHLAQALLGHDARQIERAGEIMVATTRATMVGAITALALAAVDVALWDLRGARAGEPLWQMAGGAHTSRPLYDTEGGWLQLPGDELVAGAQRAQANGFSGVKIKVGKPSMGEDFERLAAVRKAVGTGFDIMVDANQAFTAAEAIRRARTYEDLNIAWFEEPLPADDVSGHARLARSTSVPIAVGESLYSIRQFAEYLSCGAAGIVQVDAARIGGITPWLKVAHAAEASNVAVAPHFLMDLHASLACAAANATYVEHIPQLGPLTRSRPIIIDGHIFPPSTAGLGIDWNWDAIENHRVA